MTTQGVVMSPSAPSAFGTPDAGPISFEGDRYTRPSCSWTSIAVSRSRPHGPPMQRRPFGSQAAPFTVHRSPFTVHQPPCNVQRAPCTVHRTNDEFLVAVEKQAGLPIGLGRHVQAAVPVGHHPAFEAQRESAHRAAVLQGVEHHRQALFRECRGNAGVLLPVGLRRGSRCRTADVMHGGSATPANRTPNAPRAAAHGRQSSHVRGRRS